MRGKPGVAPPYCYSYSRTNDKRWSQGCKGARMVITIDPGSQEPLYRQIRSQIIEAIAAGELVAGDGLPSVRALASDLGVNLHTVNKAYAVLRDEGYLTMRGRSGAVVARRDLTSVRKRAGAQDELMAEELRRLALAFKARGGDEEAFVGEARAQARSVFGNGCAQGCAEGGRDER